MTKSFSVTTTNLIFFLKGGGVVMVVVSTTNYSQKHIGITYTSSSIEAMVLLIITIHLFLVKKKMTM